MFGLELVENRVVRGAAAPKEARRDILKWIVGAGCRVLAVDDFRSPNRISRFPHVAQRMWSLNESTAFPILRTKRGNGPRRWSCMRATIVSCIRWRASASARAFVFSSPFCMRRRRVRSDSLCPGAPWTAPRLRSRRGRRRSCNDVNIRQPPVDRAYQIPPTWGRRRREAARVRAAAAGRRVECVSGWPGDFVTQEHCRTAAESIWTAAGQCAGDWSEDRHP